MSDDMATHRGKRRNIRRLTRRKIELPIVGSSLAPPARRDTGSDDAPVPPTTTLSASPPEPAGKLNERTTNADGSVASSLAELRLPNDPTNAGEGSPDASAAAEGGATTGDRPPLAASELSEDEPATNPHIRVDDELLSARPPAESIAFGDARGSERPEGAGPQHAAGSGNGLAKEDAADSARATRTSSDVAPASTTFDDIEPATGQHRKPDAEGAKSQPAPRRPDSDAPTRPRIELSSDMALAAGRVTSLDLPPLRDEPRRGSKMPPGGEPRMISSLTGRRSSIPVSFDDDDAGARPAVIVTRSKIISDRPPKPDTESSVKAADAEPAGVTSIRASRRPGSLEGDDFETLDIDEGEVEPAAMRGEPEIDAELDEDSAPAKAPPPPPKRAAGVPPAPGGPPKAAPPPPPRMPTSPLGATTTGPIAVAAIPSPTPPPPAPALPGAAIASASPAVAPVALSGAAAAPRKPGGRQQPRRRQWWETLFSDEYLRTVVRPTSAQIARQVDFMQASLGVSKGTALLDVGCGLGQHALEFARRGCLVVALDLALPMITRAAEDAQQEGLRINFLHKDIRDIGFEGTFDAVVCVGTTFGFFDDEQNREVLGRLANALKPGGRLLLEVVNRDHVLGSQPNLQWFEGDGCVVMEESDFNYYSSRLSVKRTMMREDGRQTESEYSIRLYALHELGQMMNQAGFRVKEVSGAQATRGVFFGAQSNRIILLAERRTPNPARGNGHGTSDPPQPPSSS